MFQLESLSVSITDPAWGWGFSAAFFPFLYGKGGFYDSAISLLEDACMRWMGVKLKGDIVSYIHPV